MPMKRTDPPACLPVYLLGECRPRGGQLKPGVGVWPRTEQWHTLDPRRLVCPGLTHRPIWGRNMDKFGWWGKTMTKGRGRVLLLALWVLPFWSLGDSGSVWRVSVFLSKPLLHETFSQPFHLVFLFIATQMVITLCRGCAPPASGSITAPVTWLPEVEGRLETLLAESKGASQGQLCRDLSGSTFSGVLPRARGVWQREAGSAQEGLDELSRLSITTSFHAFPAIMSGLSAVRQEMPAVWNGQRTCTLASSGLSQTSLTTKGKKNSPPTSSQEPEISPILEPFPGVMFIANFQRKLLELRGVKWPWDNQALDLDFQTGY